MVPKVPKSGCFACDTILEAGSMKKRLIVCCDGTSNASDKGKESNPTNISRLSRVIANIGYDSETGKQIPQVVYYSSGIGTGAMSVASEKVEQGLGLGMDEKIAEAYTYLANNYGPGDEIFIFGFSRGAYTARSLAKMICQIGLLTADMMDYFDEIFQVYNNRGDKHFTQTTWAKSLASTSKENGVLGLSQGVLERLQADLGIQNPTNMNYLERWAHPHVRIKVVGVFDTVGSVGLAGRNKQPGTDIKHYSSSLDPKIQHAFHALALDEHRGNFPPTLYWLSDECKKAGVDLRQCWFPGYHGSIGGTSDAKFDTNSMDEITFSWMIDQLDGLLQFSTEALKYPITARLDKRAVNGPDPKHSPPPTNPAEANDRRVQWSDGYFQETDSTGWKLLSLASSLGQYSEYIRVPGLYYASEGTGNVDYSNYNETIHPTVWHRMQTLKYKPPQLGDGSWHREAVGGGQGFEWVKKASHGQKEIRLKEYVIPDLRERAVEEMNGMHHWSGSLERKVAPKGLLEELDGANKNLLELMRSGVKYVH